MLGLWRQGHCVGIQRLALMWLMIFRQDDFRTVRLSANDGGHDSAPPGMERSHLIPGGLPKACKSDVHGAGPVDTGSGHLILLLSPLHKLLPFYRGHQTG